MEIEPFEDVFLLKMGYSIAMTYIAMAGNFNMRCFICIHFFICSAWQSSWGLQLGKMLFYVSLLIPTLCLKHTYPMSKHIHQRSNMSVLSPLRKRRRQAWHAKRELKSKKKCGKHATRKQRKTLDDGQFDATLKPRRAITIGDKLKVVSYYEKMRKERAARAETEEPRKRKKKTDEQDETEDQDTPKVKSLEKLCQERFPQIVRHCTVKKWVVTSAREKWFDLPRAVRNRITVTPNTWRQELGLTKRGRQEGGAIPLGLQVELDKLIADMAAGSSEITDRKEVVTAEDVDP